jgi:transcriptional regulator with XRE-family HTH domain
MPNKKRAYRTLKEWRKAQFPRQADAAAALSVSQAFYSRVERALQAPSPKLAQAISEKTGVPLETILGLS